MALVVLEHPLSLQEVIVIVVVSIFPPLFEVDEVSGQYVVVYVKVLPLLVIVIVVLNTLGDDELFSEAFGVEDSFSG